MARKSDGPAYRYGNRLLGQKAGDLPFSPVEPYLHLHLHLSRSLADRWGTAGDITTISLHSSAFRSMMFHSRPVNSLKRWEDNIQEWNDLEWNIILLKAEERRKLVVKICSGAPVVSQTTGQVKVKVKVWLDRGELGISRSRTKEAVSVAVVSYY